MSTRPAAPTSPADGSRLARLLVLCTAILFEGLSLSGVHVQLVRIQNDLGLQAAQLQLVAGTFLIAYAGFLLVGGRCADRWGARRMFLLGTAVFGLGSLGGGLAQHAWQVIAARALQGAGAAATTPAAVALIVSGTTPGSARNRAFGIFSAMGAIGFSFGGIIGGSLTDWLGWRAGFHMYVPMSLLVLASAPRLLGDPGPQDSGPGITWWPAMVVTAGLIAVVYAVGGVGTMPWSEVFAAGSTGLLLLGCFMLGQARTNNPLVPRHLLSDPRVMAPAIALGGGFSAVTGAMFLVATSLQKEYGHSALDVGLVLLPQGLAVAVLSAAAARWTHQVSSIRRLLAGLALLAVGQFLYLGSAASGYSDHLLPGTLLVGAGIAVMYPAATLMASAAAGPEQQGTASGLLTTHQQVGSASGLAVVTMLQTAWPSGHGFAAVPGLGACLVVTVLTLAGCAWMLQAHRRPQHATTVGRHKDEPAAVAPTQPRI